MNYKYGQAVFLVFILGASLVLGLWLHAWQNGHSRAGDTIGVTGSAKQEVSSDLAKWTASFTRQAKQDNLQMQLEASKYDIAQIKKFISTYDLPESAVTFIPMQTDVIYAYNPSIGYTQEISGYTIRQQVFVESKEIEKIDKLAQEASKLIDQGIVPEYQRTEYFYTQLDALRPALFAQATQDAQKRAESIAQGTGVAVGQLRTAKTGVIQVLPPNSIDVSDYGQYDLSTKQKVVSATVNVSFELR